MNFANSLAIDKRLFRAEIRAAIAHCNGLFRAGIVTRLEAERLKNGLWTILKRADFDRNFFDDSSAPDVFAFIEARLFQLVNDAASVLPIGRSRPHQFAAALRLWLRDETEAVIELLENLDEILRQAPDKAIFAAFAESIRRDENKFRAVLENVNQMPSPQFDEADERINELDFDGIAHELGFQKVIENSLDAAFDRDFCLDFTHVASSAMLHLSNFVNVMLRDFAKDAPNRIVLETIRGKSARIFSSHAALLTLLRNSPLETSGEQTEICEIVFNAADVIKACLREMTVVLKR